MNKKQRIISLIIGIVLVIVGLACFGVADMMQDKLGNNYVSIFIIFGFVFPVLSIIYLCRKVPKMMLAELQERAERLESENNFFATIKGDESIHSIREKFLKAGFSQEHNYLHKKSFSLAKDYINYYAVIVNDADIEQYVNVFLEKIEAFTESQKLFKKNNYIYLIFFKNRIYDDELMFIKKLIINQDVIQEIPSSRADTLIPIVYNVEKHEFVIRMNRSKLSLKPINIAMKTFGKIVFRN